MIRLALCMGYQVLCYKLSQNLVAEIINIYDSFCRSGRNLGSSGSESLLRLQSRYQPGLQLCESSTGAGESTFNKSSWQVCANFGRWPQFFPTWALPHGCLGILHNMVADFPQSTQSKGPRWKSWPSLGSHTLSLLPYVICHKDKHGFNMGTYTMQDMNTRGQGILKVMLRLATTPFLHNPQWHMLHSSLPSFSQML